MGYVWTALGAILLGLFANYISPPFNRFVDRCFSWFFHFFDPDRFDLSGTWQQTFRERDPQNLEQFREVKEKIRLKHLGNTVSGDGKTDIDPRDFSYQCRIKHNLFFGSYVKKGEKGNISGRGMIQLVVAPDRLSMVGQATWYDQDTGKIESSNCTWTKLS